MGNNRKELVLFNIVYSGSLVTLLLSRSQEIDTNSNEKKSLYMQHMKGSNDVQMMFKSLNQRS